MQKQIKVVNVDSFSVQKNAKCEVLTCHDLKFQRRNIFLLVSVAMAYKEIELKAKCDLKYVNFKVTNDYDDYAYRSHFTENHFKHIWAHFGERAIRNTFIYIARDKNKVQNVANYMRNHLIPLLNSSKVPDSTGRNQLQLQNLVTIIDSYKDYRFRTDIVPTINAAIYAFEKIVEGI